jgi:hypothetical protein
LYNAASANTNILHGLYISMNRPDFEREREREPNLYTPPAHKLWRKKENRGIEKGSWQGGYVRRQVARRGLTGE